nr:MAG TPA: hypothetical protein [Caudoviricetes sp.]
MLGKETNITGFRISTHHNLGRQLQYNILTRSLLRRS